MSPLKEGPVLEQPTLEQWGGLSLPQLPPPGAISSGVGNSGAGANGTFTMFLGDAGVLTP